MQLQLTKASRQIQELETRLAAHEKRSSTIAERLHGVMENQWREALNIISSPNENVCITILNLNYYYYYLIYDLFIF